MKFQLSNSNKAIVAMLVAVAVGIASWTMVLSPKREEASKLDAQAEAVKASLAQHRAEIAAAEQARADFPDEYERLVVLGKAVPGDDDTASLFIQVTHIADRAGVRFSDLELSAEASGVEAAPEATAPEGSAAPVSPTEAAAATMPLGATIGPAGLGVMPYTLIFEGSFFQVADFIAGLDSLVKTQNEKVLVDGRLLTLDAFTLEGDEQDGFPQLKATFAVSTYLTPPGEGVAGGATPTGPETTTATPAATTLGGTP